AAKFVLVSIANAVEFATGLPADRESMERVVDIVADTTKRLFSCGGDSSAAPPATTTTAAPPGVIPGPPAPWNTTQPPFVGPPQGYAPAGPGPYPVWIPPQFNPHPNAFGPPLPVPMQEVQAAFGARLYGDPRAAAHLPEDRGASNGR
ncbi:hypothetical protein C0992_009643, partial [Termitomyces sp. T32_za158]